MARRDPLPGEGNSRPGATEPVAPGRLPTGLSDDLRRALEEHRRRGLKLDRGAPGSADLVPSAAADRVRRDLDGTRKFALAQHLDQLTGTHRAGPYEVVDVDPAALGEQLGDLAEVDHLVLGAEPVGEALELRHPHVQGHLATLEPGRHLLAGLGALGAATGRLALGALTATHSGLGRVCPGRGPQVVNLQASAAGLNLGRVLGLVHLRSHESTSSTVTRWVTVRIMPRTSGRSSRTTVSWR